LADKSKLVRASWGVSNISQTWLRSFSSQWAKDNSYGSAGVRRAGPWRGEKSLVNPQKLAILRWENDDKPAEDSGSSIFKHNELIFQEKRSWNSHSFHVGIHGSEDLWFRRADHTRQTLTVTEHPLAVPKPSKELTHPKIWCFNCQIYTG
jgi:hypothetical protein